MTTWSDFRTRVRASTKDAGANPKVGDEQLLFFFNLATRWAAHRHPLFTTADVSLTDGQGALPADLIHVDRVLSDSDELEQEFTGFPDKTQYYLYGDTVTVGDSDLTTVTVHYQAFYPDVTADTDVLPIPVWLESAVFWYTCAEAMYHRGADVSTINQWDTKLDAGNPEHNPLLRVAEAYMKLAEKELARAGI